MEIFQELVRAQEALLEANRRAVAEEDAAAFAAAEAAAQTVKALYYRAFEQGLDGDELAHQALVEAKRLQRLQAECLRFEWLDRLRSSLS